MSNPSYSSDFFAVHEKRSLSSAEEIIPIVWKYIQPESVIDIGCGNGTWLKVWETNGVKSILGVDGPYVKTEQLLIDRLSFRACNLEQGYISDRKYDLVTSLEVAEHLAPQYASNFVQSLCKLGDVILFSAALPGQPGTYHVNEQYPDYWAKLFLEHGYVAIDCLRHQIWNNKQIEWWYRQNVMFFVKTSVLSKYGELNNEHIKWKGEVCTFVHPELLEEKNRLAAHYKRLLQNPLKALLFFVKKILGK